MQLENRNPDIWSLILSRLRLRVDTRSFDTWLQPTCQASWVPPDLTIKVPNQAFGNWIREHFLDEVRSILDEIGHSGAQVSFEAPAPETHTPTQAALYRPHRPAIGSPARTDQNPRVPRPDNGSSLIRRYSFENFVVSSCNQFAHAASLAVTEQPAIHYNPLYLYGGVGLGKTHLMQAIGNRLRNSRMELHLVYLSAEKFMNELINAIRFEKTFDFKRRYRDVDILLIDDIQFLAGKERTQEEFFYTFNALYESQKQIVMTSDCHPREIPTLEERLRSRFEWGLIADIQPPDLETKVAILRKKADAHRFDLPQEVAFYISGRTGSNIRELEGSLIRLMAYSSMTGRPIDLALAEEALSDLLTPERPTVKVERIQKTVADHYKVRVTDLKAKNNRRQIVLPRQVAMYLCKSLTSMSLPAIGGSFGGKHHATVIHAIRKIKNLQEQDRDLRRTIDNLTQSLN